MSLISSNPCTESSTFWRGGDQSSRLRQRYRGYSKLRTHAAIGPYGRALPRIMGPSWGWCVSLFTSNPCKSCADHFVGKGMRWTQNPTVGLCVGPCDGP